MMTDIKNKCRVRNINSKIYYIKTELSFVKSKYICFKRESDLFLIYEYLRVLRSLQNSLYKKNIEGGVKAKIYQ